MTFETLIAQKLLQINAIKLSPQNPFTWASGMRSPIYCDNRITLSYPEVRSIIKNAFATISVSFGETDIIAGVATAGISHGVLLADVLNLPFCYVRAAPKSHGRQNQIEGEIRPNSRILVVEDLISTGGSSIEVVNILRAEGHRVLGVMAIFDYGFEKAKENFRNSSCKYLSLSNYNYLINEALSTNYINQTEETILKNWNSDPQNWYQNHFELK
ncbi:MAG: orotate phosphoribosyltransferase [Saprospiraceae bacterium]|nr:orotate phosphoribosyltransferase [Saprospiraceae bacterium]